MGFQTAAAQEFLALHLASVLADSVAKRKAGRRAVFSAWLSKSFDSSNFCPLSPVAPGLHS